MNNFKSRVLEPAITQINEKTDIKIKVEQHKTGRSITGFSSSLSKNKRQFLRKQYLHNEIKTRPIYSPK